MNQRIYIIVIAVLVFIILLQRSCSNSPSVNPVSDKSKIVYDTVWSKVVQTKYKKVPLIKRDTTFIAGDTIFIPDSNYEKLKEQYVTLVKNYATRNTYRDTLQLDSLGFVIITDTLQYNALKSRFYQQNLKLPTVIGYVQQEQRRQLYIGGGISINSAVALSNLQAGLLYKNKKDQIFGLHTGISQDLKPYFGVSSYWKIKLK